jgi:hypothetical protein
LWKKETKETKETGQKEMIDSIVMSWNEIEEHYLITALTRADGLVTKYAKTVKEAIEIIDELEEKYAT